MGESFSSPAEAGLYPFNAVRNRALGLAATEAVLLLDVDFLPSPGVVPAYQGTAEGYREMMAQLRRREAVVLPAFETARLKGGLPEGEALAKEAVLSECLLPRSTWPPAWSASVPGCVCTSRPSLDACLGAAADPDPPSPAPLPAAGGKSGAVSLYRAGKLLGFQVGVYPQGHSPTNYLRWSGSDRPYPVYYRKVGGMGRVVAAALGCRDQGSGEPLASQRQPGAAVGSSLAPKCGYRVGCPRPSPLTLARRRPSPFPPAPPLAGLRAVHPHRAAVRALV